MDCAKRRCDTEEAAAEASGLPDDPLVEILSRVPVKSVCRFKCVSKGWRDVIADPFHRKKLPQTLEGFFFMVQLHHDGDGEARGDEDRDEEELPRYGFVDVLQGSVRLVDLSCLTELPDIRNSRLMLFHCCNGLLLFAVKGSWSYVVCNPATKQCVAVPSSGLQQNGIFNGSVITYLLFDPAVTPCHFNLVEFSQELEGYQNSVHVYSSKTQAWSLLKPHLGCCDIAHSGVYFNGMLHLIPYSMDFITLLDVDGNIQEIIPSPCQAGMEDRTMFDYVGWSQGRLHYISSETPDDYYDDDDEEKEIDGDGSGLIEPSFHGFLIWVLEDYEREQWVLKDTVSFSNLFVGRNDYKDIHFNYYVVGIHPDHNLVFIVQHKGPKLISYQHRDPKLISYHMDTKEVRDLCALVHGYECMTPYVPCFSELLVLENKL